MKTNIRFGGAQIPVTPFQQKNVKSIKKAIDWAAENNVDYLVTPEASLSGYSTSYYMDLTYIGKCIVIFVSKLILTNIV